MPARYIVQVAFQAKDALPRDQFENVWHFSSAASSATAAEASTIMTSVSQFYTNNPGSTNAVTSYYSASLSTAVLMKAYDEDEVTRPRSLLQTGTFEITPAGGLGLPEEVALCMSYDDGRNLARHRGRLYLGPFGVSAVGAGDLAQTPSAGRPVAGLMTTIATQGERLLSTPPAGCRWCVRSGIGTGTKLAPVVTYYPIVSGWIDNEWDAQRRRRIAATNRTLFSATSEG